MMVEVYGNKQKEKADNDLLKSYLTAYFHRVDKLESFDHYKNMLQQPEKKAMTTEEMLQKVMKLHGMMKGDT